MAALLAGCQSPAPAAPSLTDPGEILVRGFGVTTTLRTVHARVEATMRTSFPGQAMPDQQQVALDADVDFTTGNLAASGVTADAGDRMGLILVNGSAFNLNATTGRWTQLPQMDDMAGLAGLAMFGVPGAQGPDVTALLNGLVADQRVTKELVGVDACAGGQCYRVRVTLPPVVVWDTIVDLMGMGNGGVVGGLGQMPPGIPPIATELLFDTGTLMLMESRLSISADGNDLSATLVLSAHDAPIAIQPPPPHLVDRFDQGFFPVP